MLLAAMPFTPPDTAFGLMILALPFTSSAVMCFSSSVRSATARSASMIWSPRTMCTSRSKFMKPSLRARSAAPALMSAPAVSFLSGLI